MTVLFRLCGWSPLRTRSSPISTTKVAWCEQNAESVRAEERQAVPERRSASHEAMRRWLRTGSRRSTTQSHSRVRLNRPPRNPAVPAAVRAADLVTKLVGRSGVTARWRHRLKKTLILRVREV